VDFAGVERYIDTPVKRYSSGMYVRRAFGVAAHLEPEILIVDEVLAVGDEAFRNKCNLKIREMQDDGKTIVFITHELTSAERIASRIIWLSQGAIRMDGDTATVLEAYRRASRDGTI